MSKAASIAQQKLQARKKQSKERTRAALTKGDADQLLLLNKRLRMITKDTIDPDKVNSLLKDMKSKSDKDKDKDKNKPRRSDLKKIIDR